MNTSRLYHSANRPRESPCWRGVNSQAPRMSSGRTSMPPTLPKRGGSEDLGEEGLSPLVLRVGQHVPGVARLDDHSAVHEDEGVTHLTSEAHLVGDHDHRHAVV